jgi:hypothetical protein
MRLVAWLSYASGTMAAVGVVFLAAMFASFAVGASSQALAVGRINDVLVTVSYLLALPSVIALGMLLRQHAPALSVVATVIGVGALGAIVVLQWLLITEVLSFEVQVGPVSIALLVLGAWFVAVGYLGRSGRVLPNGVRMGVLAATYVGYPVWAFWLGRNLMHLGRSEVDSNGATGGLSTLLEARNDD